MKRATGGGHLENATYTLYIYIYISQYHTGQSKLLYDQRKSTALGNRVHILRDILYMPVWHTLPMLLYSRLHPGLLCSLSWYHMHILYLILPISTDDAIYMHTYVRLHSTAFFIFQRIHDQCDEKQKTKIHSIDIRHNQSPLSHNLHYAVN